jgi:hypothetical protein
LKDIRRSVGRALLLSWVTASGDRDAEDPSVEQCICSLWSA